MFQPNVGPGNWCIPLLADENPGPEKAWLARLQANPCEVLVLTPDVVSTFAHPSRAERVRNKKAHLFELRGQLFSQQRAILSALDRAVTLAERGTGMVRQVPMEAHSLKVRYCVSISVYQNKCLNDNMF